MREPCYKCKFEHKSIDREPCDHCSDVYIKTGDHPAFQYAKPATNYDRIIRKSLEELSEFIEKLTKGLIVPPGCPKAGCKSEYCQKCWLDWLKEEAE